MLHRLLKLDLCKDFQNHRLSLLLVLLALVSRLPFLRLKFTLLSSSLVKQSVNASSEAIGRHVAEIFSRSLGSEPCTHRKSQP